MTRNIFYEFEEYRLDAGHLALLCLNSVRPPIALDPQTCELLRVFLNNPRKVLSFDFLIQQAWDLGASNEAVSYQISILRQILGDDHRNPRFIKTYRKKGFEFLPEVRTIGFCGGPGQLYEKARHFFHKSTEADVTKAIEYYEQVIALRGDCVADAYAGIAESFVLLGSFAQQNAPAIETMEKARTAARQALKLDPNSAEAHAALASIAALHDWDWTTAAEHFTKAVTLAGNPLVKPLVRAWYANCLAGRGETELARTEIDQARADHPSSPLLAALSGRVAYLSRDAATAIRECDEAITLEKHLYLSHVFKGHALRLAGEYGEALKSFTRACELNENNPVCLAEVAHLHGLERRDENARTILTSLHVMAESRYIPRHAFAYIYLGLGETPKALDLLMKACDEREAWLIFLTSDPVYDPLREYQKFRDLVQRVGFTRSKKLESGLAEPHRI